MCNPPTGAVQVRLDCIKLELSEQMLHSYYDSRLRLSDARPPKMPKLTLNYCLSCKVIFKWTPCVFPSRILMEDMRMEVPKVATSGQLVSESMQVPNSGKMYISAERRHTAIYATIHALCTLMFIP